MGKSFLKSPYDKYQELIPVIDVDKLEALLDRDVESCKVNVEQAQDAFKKVTLNFEKFLLTQEKELQTFIFKQ